jgi:hypothetical protein
MRGSDLRPPWFTHAQNLLHLTKAGRPYLEPHQIDVSAMVAQITQALSQQSAQIVIGEPIMAQMRMLLMTFSWNG